MQLPIRQFFVSENLASWGETSNLIVVNIEKEYSEYICHIDERKTCVSNIAEMAWMSSLLRQLQRRLILSIYSFFQVRLDIILQKSYCLGLRQIVFKYKRNFANVVIMKPLWIKYNFVPHLNSNTLQ